MLALALLDRIVSVDKQQQWLLYLSNSGYLKVLVDSLVEDDRTLQSLLTPQPPLLKALYTYESKMVRVVDIGIRSAASLGPGGVYWKAAALSTGLLLHPEYFCYINCCYFKSLTSGNLC